MKKKTRAIRRHKTRAYQKRQQKYVKDIGLEILPLGYYFCDNGLSCSSPLCLGCRNPRRLRVPKKDQLTIQEKKNGLLDKINYE